MRNDGSCFICGKHPEDDELAPLATRIGVHNALGHGAMFDPSEVQAWMHIIAQRPEQHINLCASCANEHVMLSSEAVAVIAEKEGAKHQLNEVQIDKFRKRAERDEKDRVTKRAKKLGVK